MDRIHSWEYAELRNQAFTNDGKDAPYNAYMIDMYKSGEDPVFWCRGIVGADQGGQVCGPLSEGSLPHMEDGHTETVKVVPGYLHDIPGSGGDSHA